MKTPLKNKLFISTRPKEQADELKHLLEKAGADVLDMPLIDIRRAKPTNQETGLLDAMEQIQWLILTSPNGMRYFFQILEERGISKLPDKLQIAVIGRKTEEVLASFGYSAAFVNPGNTAEDFVAAFIPKIKNESNRPRVLLALGNLARTIIQDELSCYAECLRVNVYETVSPDWMDEKIVQRIRDNHYEMLIFTSPSAIQNFMKQVNNIPAENLRAACIGEITASEARKQGFQPLVVAKDASAQGIVDSIIQYYS